MQNSQSITEYSLNAEGETNFLFKKIAEATGDGQLVSHFYNNEE